MKRISLCGIAAIMLLTACSCGAPRDPNEKVCVPVKGEVYVDGAPAEGLLIQLHDVSIPENNTTEIPDFTVSSATTNPEGKFQVSTYRFADGAPPGEYVMTFMWGELNKLSMQYGGPDKLNGRYTERSKSEHRVTVAEGKDVDVGRIELTSK